jgi:hypothetical protein
MVSELIPRHGQYAAHGFGEFNFIGIAGLADIHHGAERALLDDTAFCLDRNKCADKIKIMDHVRVIAVLRQAKCCQAKS